MVAIGGIDVCNVASLAGTGIGGVAVIHGIFGKEDVRQGAAELKGLLKTFL